MNAEDLYKFFFLVSGYTKFEIISYISYRLKGIQRNAINYASEGAVYYYVFICVKHENLH